MWDIGYPKQNKHVRWMTYYFVPRTCFKYVLVFCFLGQVVSVRLTTMLL